MKTLKFKNKMATYNINLKKINVGFYAENLFGCYYQWEFWIIKQ